MVEVTVPLNSLMDLFTQIKVLQIGAFSVKQTVYCLHHLIFGLGRL